MGTSSPAGRDAEGGWRASGGYGGSAWTPHPQSSIFHSIPSCLWASGIQTKGGLQQKGESYNEFPGCCQPGALPHRTDARQVAVCQARACLGLAGGPAGRQSQLPRKVPLNFPCCLQTLPRPLQPRWPRPSTVGLHCRRLPASCVLGHVQGHRIQESSLLPSLAPGLPALALGRRISIGPPADPAGSLGGRGIKGLSCPSCEASASYMSSSSSSSVTCPSSVGGDNLGSGVGQTWV